MAALNLRDFSEWKVHISTYQPGDYVKVEFRDDITGESGQLDNEPIVNKELRRILGG
jgi:hypothetical protein